MATNNGVNTSKKVTRPPWERWYNFKRNGKRAFCNHCNVSAQDACKAAKRHLSKCELYKSLFPEPEPVAASQTKPIVSGIIA